MSNLRKGLAMPKNTGSVSTIGTVKEVFGDDAITMKFYDKNRVCFIFEDTNTNEEFLVVLSNGLANSYASGKLTPAMLWNLPIYKVTENAEGEPLTDSKGEVIPHMLVMGSTQQAGKSVKDMKFVKIDKEMYTPESANAFDEYF